MNELARTHTTLCIAWPPSRQFTTADVLTQGITIPCTSLKRIWWMYHTRTRRAPEDKEQMATEMYGSSASKHELKIYDARRTPLDA